MRKVYAVVGSSMQTVTFKDVAIATGILMDGDRPTPEHIAAATGKWVLPIPTDADILMLRRHAYKTEVDFLSAEAARKYMQGEDLGTLLAEISDKVAEIKERLPLPAPVVEPDPVVEPEPMVASEVP